MKRPSMQIGLGIALGIGIGVAVAVILGSGGAWLTVGIVLGVIVGKAMSPSKRNDMHGETSHLLPKAREKWVTQV
jgi:hypothetical protein